jgi:hypothetical protein
VAIEMTGIKSVHSSKIIMALCGSELLCTPSTSSA